MPNRYGAVTLCRRGACLALRTFLLATLLATQLLSAILSTAIAQTAAQAPVEILAHQGFRADIAALAGAPRRNEIIAALRRQIDICAEAGLSANVLAYMRSVPVRLKVFQPGEPGFNSGPGFYNGKNITLVPMLYEPANPILLHELLHAYHHDRLPDGNKNADVLEPLAKLFGGFASLGLILPDSAVSGRSPYRSGLAWPIFRDCGRAASAACAACA